LLIAKIVTRADAHSLLTKYMSNQNLLKHSYAAEAAMKGIYRRLYPNGDSETEEIWGMTGLLHDIDYQLAQETNQLDKHGSLIFEKEEGIPDVIAHAIKAHNYEGTKIDPESDLDWAIAIVDGLTGFIVACALVRPEKNLESVTVDAVSKRLSQPAFSRNVRREVIYLCEKKLGTPLPEFIKITLTSMQSIHTELGL
jgi:predicted hydrolase (HD superfamily)